MYAGSEWQLPHSWGICLRSILPFHPALRLIALSGSSAVASPPWQFTQLSPFSTWMSNFKLSALTPSGSGSAEWQSRQEFVVCPQAEDADSTSRTKVAIGPATKFRNLFRKMSINAHTGHVHEGNQRKGADPLFRTGWLPAFQQRQQQPYEAGQAKGQHSQNLTVNRSYF